MTSPNVFVTPGETNPADVTLLPAPGIALRTGPAAFLFAGSPVNLTDQDFLAAGSGAFVFTGSPATLTDQDFLAAGSGAFAFTGSSVTLTDQDFLAAGSGAFIFAGAGVDFTVVAGRHRGRGGIPRDRAFAPAISGRTGLCVSVATIFPKIDVLSVEQRSGFFIGEGVVVAKVVSAPTDISRAHREDEDWF